MQSSSVHTGTRRLPLLPSRDCQERWQELSAAYEILSDPGKQKLWEEAKRQEVAVARLYSH